MSKESLGPLTGVTVLEFGHLIAAPFATMALADLGADVIKVEPLTGDLCRSVGGGKPGSFGDVIFMSANRNKRSIAIDLREPRGLALVSKLVAKSDVVVQGLRPGVMERFGLDYPTLSKENSKLIYVSVSGYPSWGSNATWTSVDGVAQAETGMMSITGQPDGPPTMVGFSVVDTGTAYMVTQSVLAALLHRARTDEGNHVEVSLYEVGLHIQTNVWGRYWANGIEPGRKSRHPDAAPSSEVIAVRDGSIVLSAYKQEHWAAFCKLVGRSELSHDARFETNEDRVANREELLIILAEILSEKTMDECIGSGELLIGGIRGYSQVEKTPAFKSSGMLIEIERPGGGTCPTFRLPYRLSSSPTPRMDPPPALGEHSIEIAKSAGLSEETINELVSAGVVGVS